MVGRPVHAKGHFPYHGHAGGQDDLFDGLFVAADEIGVVPAILRAGGLYGDRHVVTGGHLFDAADVFYQLMGGVVERQLAGGVVHNAKGKQRHGDKHSHKSRRLQTPDERPGHYRTILAQPSLAYSLIIGAGSCFRAIFVILR